MAGTLQTHTLTHLFPRDCLRELPQYPGVQNFYRKEIALPLKKN